MNKILKKKQIKIFLITLSFIFNFIQLINFSLNFQHNTDLNLSNEKNNNYFGLARVESDWEISQGSGTIAIINKPSGTKEDNLLILHCTTDGQGSSLTGPVGWTILLPETMSGQQTTASWYKIVGAIEPLSYNVSWTGEEGYVAGIIRITGYNETDPIQTTASDTGNGDIINPSVTTTKDNTLIIGFHGLDDNDPGDDYGSTLESGPTVLYAKNSTGISDPCSAGIYYEVQKNQGATPTRTWTMPTNEGWYAATVAINMKGPFITIINPIENEVFGVDAPNFTVEIVDPNLQTKWYTIDGGLNNYTFIINDTINQGAWDARSDGKVTIRFYANNTLGDINYEQVNVIKDTKVPNINIISPTEDKEFGIDPPSFVVEINDPNLDTMWYSIYNSTDHSLNITFTDNGTIDTTEWSKLSDGAYTIRFYANDTLGNLNFEEVNIIKDIYAIVIKIINPVENEIFAFSAPDFIIEIQCAFLNTTWYTLAGAPYKYIFIANGTINQTAWSSFSDGLVPIRFYANNTIGEINYKDVNVIKDTTGPVINVISPTKNQICGLVPPNFVVEITDLNLDTMWYSIYNSSHQSLNITFTDNGIVNPTEWSAIFNGNYTIRFYANDTVGNINFEDVNITKDIYAIFIDIINPLENQIFGFDAPNFLVKINCAFLNVTWYTIDGGINNFTFTANETINEAVWDALPDGVITLIFYANNTLGDINFEHVNIQKDASAPIININSPTANEVFGIDAPSFSVDITDPHLDTMWYTVNNSATKFIFAGDGVVDQTVWDIQVDGDVLLTFYANDTVGNIDSENVIIIKRTPRGGTGPDITTIIIIVSVIGGIAAAGVILGVLVKQGKISLEKLTKRKPKTEKIKSEKPPKEKVKKEKTKQDKASKEKTDMEETPTE
ncbi:MAG: hypothetical protein ACFFCV_15285 [Promethearchaeota archaeon]